MFENQLKEENITMQITLQTFLVSTNVWMSSKQRKNLFEKLFRELTKNQDYSLTQRHDGKRETNIKNINAPIGTLFGISCEDITWGASKTKKKISDEDKLLKELLTGNSDSKSNFKNTLGFYISMENNNVHIMRFSDSLKIAGCKTIDEALKASIFLWKYIEPYSDCYKVMHTSEDLHPNTIKHAADPTMINLNFHTGFIVDVEKFLALMEKKYLQNIFEVRWKDTPVLICFRTKNEKEMTYKMVSFEKGNLDKMLFSEIDRKEYVELTELIYAYNPRASRKNRKPLKPVRLKVNRSGTIMVTGSYLKHMTECCEIIDKILKENKEEIIEKLKPPEEVDDSFDLQNFRI